MKISLAILEDGDLQEASEVWQSKARAQQGIPPGCQEVWAAMQEGWHRHVQRPEKNLAREAAAEAVKKIKDQWFVIFVTKIGIVK